MLKYHNDQQSPVLQKRSLDVQVAAISVAILGLVNLASAFEYLVLYGYSQSLMGAELIGFLYPFILLIAAYFDSKRKVLALVLSAILCGLSLVNSTLTISPALDFTTKFLDSASLAFSIIGALACILVLARIMYKDENAKPRRR